MLQSLKPPVFITILVAAVLIIGVIGYKLIAPSAPPPQTHAPRWISVPRWRKSNSKIWQALHQPSHIGKSLPKYNYLNFEQRTHDIGRMT